MLRKKAGVFTRRPATKRPTAGQVGQSYLKWFVCGFGMFEVWRIRGRERVERRRPHYPPLKISRLL